MYRKMQKAKIKKIKRPSEIIFQRAGRVENATNLRKSFLRIVSGSETYLVSDRAAVRSVIIPADEYERILHGRENRLPALAVMGARPCLKTDAVRAIESINRAERYFSKIVFVHSKATEQYASHFKAADLRLIKNARPDLPLITSLKLAVSALSGPDQFLVFCFLSKPCAPELFKKISGAASAAKKRGDIIITKTADKPSHPVALSRKYFKALLTTRKELGIPRIIRQFQKDIVYVES